MTQLQQHRAVGRVEAGLARSALRSVTNLIHTQPANAAVTLKQIKTGLGVEAVTLHGLNV